MSDDQIRKLNAIKNYSTRYELAVERDGRRFRIAYTVRHSRAGLLAAVRQHGTELVDFANSDDMRFESKFVAHIGNAKVWFTGRTQHQSIIEGELVWLSTEMNNRKAAAVA